MLIRLREATSKMNRATDDPRMKAIMEKSWLLQDRLILVDKACGVNLFASTYADSPNSPIPARRVLFVVSGMFIFAVFFMSLGRREMGLMGST